MVRRIHHVGIVVRRLAEAYRFYRDTLGLPLLREAELPDQGVRAALLAAGESEVELLEPVDPGGGVARFLARRGEGLHHFCFDTPAIAFLHPRACAGVLIELAAPAGESGPRRAPLDLKRLVIGAAEPKRTADLFRSLFGLHEVAINGGARTMLAVGQGALLVVPAEEVGGTEGLVALSLVAEPFDALIDACDRARVKLLRGTGEVTVDPESSHGVHLHISRYRFP